MKWLKVKKILPKIGLFILPQQISVGPNIFMPVQLLHTKDPMYPINIYSFAIGSALNTGANRASNISAFPPKWSCVGSGQAPLQCGTLNPVTVVGAVVILTLIPTLTPTITTTCNVTPALKTHWSRMGDREMLTLSMRIVITLHYCFICLNIYNCALKKERLGVQDCKWISSFSFSISTARTEESTDS